MANVNVEPLTQQEGSPCRSRVSQTAVARDHPAAAVIAPSFDVDSCGRGIVTTKNLVTRLGDDLLDFDTMSLTKTPRNTAEVGPLR